MSGPVWTRFDCALSYGDKGIDIVCGEEKNICFTGTTARPPVPEIDTCIAIQESFYMNLNLIFGDMNMTVCCRDS